MSVIFSHKGLEVQAMYTHMIVLRSAVSTTTNHLYDFDQVRGFSESFSSKSTRRDSKGISVFGSRTIAASSFGAADIWSKNSNSPTTPCDRARHLTFQIHVTNSIAKPRKKFKRTGVNKATLESKHTKIAVIYGVRGYLPQLVCR